MPFGLGWGEFIVLLLVGLFVFGPERLPRVIADAVRTLRTLRDMARNATTDLRAELGPDVDLADLHPKTFVRKHLLSEEDEEFLRRPFQDAMRDVEELAHVDDVVEARRQPPSGSAGDAGGAARSPRFDPDAT